MVDHIFNGEQGAKVREKLNEVIDRTNALMGVEGHGGTSGNPHNTRAVNVPQDNEALGPNVQTALDDLHQRQSSDNSNNSAHANDKNNPHEVRADQVAQDNAELGDDVQEALDALHTSVTELVEMLPEKADLDHIDGLETQIQLRRGTNPYEAWNDDLMVGELFFHYTKGQLYCKLNGGELVMIGSQSFIEDAPEDGYTYGREDGQWVRVGATQVQDGPPENPVVGTLWYDTGHTAELYVWDGASWVSMTGAGGGGADTADNVVLDDADSTLRNVALAREISSEGDGFWRQIYTSDLVTENNQPMFPGRAGDDIRNQRDANHYLLDLIESMNGCIISDEEPVDPPPSDGDMWFDNADDSMQLYMWHEDSDAWIKVAPPVTLEGRVSDGEVTQQSIIEQIQEGLAEQGTLKDKVAALEGSVGEHSLVFNPGMTPEDGQFTITDGMSAKNTLSGGSVITMSGTDREGNGIAIDRITQGDVLRLSDISQTAAELKITSVNGGGAFGYEKLFGDLDRLSEYPYDFNVFSSFDPQGLATIDYVDKQDDKKLSKSGGKISGRLGFEAGGHIDSGAATSLSGRAGLEIKAHTDHPIAVTSGSTYKEMLAFYGYNNSAQDKRSKVAYIKSNGQSHFKSVSVGDNNEQLATQKYVNERTGKDVTTWTFSEGDLNPLQGQFSFADKGSGKINLIIANKTSDGILWVEGHGRESDSYFDESFFVSVTRADGNFMLIAQCDGAEWSRKNKPHSYINLRDAEWEIDLVDGEQYCIQIPALLPLVKF